MNTLPPASIAKALVAAQRGVRKVEKASRNEHHGYAYASAQDIATEAQRALNAAGLALSRIGWSHQPLAEGNPARLVVSYMLVSDAGESWMLDPVSVPSLPGKGRPEDKAEAGALTYSAGYVAQGLLQIERVDEHDVDARNDNEEEPASGPVGDDVRIVIEMLAHDPREARKQIRAAWDKYNKAERVAINAAIDQQKATK